MTSLRFSSISFDSLSFLMASLGLESDFCVCERGVIECIHSVPYLYPSRPVSLPFLTSASFFFDLPKRCILAGAGRLLDPLAQLSRRAPPAPPTVTAAG